MCPQKGHGSCVGQVALWVGVDTSKYGILHDQLRGSWAFMMKTWKQDQERHARAQSLSQVITTQTLEEQMRTRTGDRQGHKERQSAAVKGQVQLCFFILIISIWKVLKKWNTRENFAKRYTIHEQWKRFFQLPRWIKDLKNVEIYCVCGLRKHNIFKMPVLLKLQWKSQEALFLL